MTTTFETLASRGPASKRPRDGGTRYRNEPPPGGGSRNASSPPDTNGANRYPALDPRGHLDLHDLRPRTDAQQSVPVTVKAIEDHPIEAGSLLGFRLLEDAPAKPAYLQPCNGCGVCCALEPCAIAHDYIASDVVGPCPALDYDDGRFVCGMTRRPSRYMGLPNDWADPMIGSLFADALGIGRGCDAGD